MLVTGKKTFFLKKLSIILFIKLKGNFLKIPGKVKKLFFKFLCWVRKKNEKTVRFFEHHYLMNQCIFFADVLVNCYPQDTQKSEPKFFDNSSIFHNGGHFDLCKKMVKLIVWFLEKRTNYFLGIILVQALLPILKNIAWKIQVNTMHRSWDISV